MKMFGFVILAALLALSSANCGCLKCSKHLRVVSPPCSPVQVIYRGFPDDSCAMGMPTPNPCPRPLPYQVQTPVVLPNPLGCSLKEYNYKIQPIRLVAPKPQEHCYREYEIKVQAPVTLPSLPPVLLKPLKARTDRIVIPAPEVLYCQNQVAQQQQQQQQILQQQQQQEQQVYVAPKPCQAAAPPTIEAYVPEKECYCHYRYEDLRSKRRKRELPIVRHGVNFFMNILPDFIRMPIKSTLRSLKHDVNSYNRKLKKNIKAVNNKNINPLVSNSRHNNLEETVSKKLIDGLRNPTIDNSRIRLESNSQKSADFNGRIASLFPQFAKYSHKQNAEIENEANKFLDSLKDMPVQEKSTLYSRLSESLRNLQKIENNEPLSHQKSYTPYKNSNNGLLEKLKIVNGDRRKKRAIVFGSDEFQIPFFQVKHLPGESSEEVEFFEYEDDDDVEVVRKSKSKLNRKSYETPRVPKSPILQLLSAPIQLLKGFHELHQHLSPVLTIFPDMITHSKHFARSFGKNLKTNGLHSASNLIGNFGDLDNPYMRRRYKRDLESENLQNLQRSRRYILKVVDEDEVQEFLREKLGKLYNGSEEDKSKPKGKTNEKKSKSKAENSDEKNNKSAIVDKYSKTRKVIVEPLKPRVIIDKNGLPFMEINGVKRPLFMKKKTKNIEESTEESQSKQESSEELETKAKISKLIELAEERKQNHGEDSTRVYKKTDEIPIQTIREKVTQNLIEIDVLVNMDFDQYSSIYDKLLNLEHVKSSIEQDWKLTLMEKRENDINSKIDLLTKFKDLQHIKDDAVKSLASALKYDNKFMSKKLIKMLIRLQKLQCIINRIIEDFEDSIKLNYFDMRKEIKYVDLLASLHFVVDKTRSSLLTDLKKERDLALEKEVDQLEKLRRLLEKNDADVIKEEAELLWEIKNIEKLQKDTINEMNERISNNLKIRKELKILFDLLKQLENCERDEAKLLKKFGNDDEDSDEKTKRKEKIDLKKYLDDRKIKLGMIRKEVLKKYAKD